MATVEEKKAEYEREQPHATPPVCVHPRFAEGEPTWELAYLFPAQGEWTETEYLALEDRCGGHARVEVVDGRLELLPMATEVHQFIILFLMDMLRSFANQHAPGKVLFSGIRIRLKEGRKPLFREPDVAYMSAEHEHRRHNRFWEGADLVMEVVSGEPSDRERDYIEKKKDYADAGIPEYWIVDPDEQRIQVHALKDGQYELHGEFRSGQQATSVLLPGFGVAVADVMVAGK